MEEILTELNRRLVRLNKLKDSIDVDHKGKETKLTYWAGYNLGYLNGKTTEIENVIDILEVVIRRQK